jgi:hypothetical protein
MFNGARKPTDSSYIENRSSPDVIQPQNCFGAASRKKSFITVRGHRAQLQPTRNLTHGDASGKQGRGCASSIAPRRFVRVFGDGHPDSHAFHVSTTLPQKRCCCTWLRYRRRASRHRPRTSDTSRSKTIRTTQLIIRPAKFVPDTLTNAACRPARACPATWSHERKRILTPISERHTQRHR